MTRVLDESKVDEKSPGTSCATCASDAQWPEHARSLLAHADSKITERVYRRKPKRVRPIR
jgi:hypothetical protein